MPKCFHRTSRSDEDGTRLNDVEDEAKDGGKDFVDCKEVSRWPWQQCWRLV